jgi:DNA sulfur modification protein DndD
MATIIKSISFSNFYNYYGSYEQNQYDFTPGVNIVNADNNMGKSKFYNGLTWLLEDKVYDSDLSCFKDANESLIKMASGKAKSEEPEFIVGVRVVFENNGITYTITKSSRFFTTNGNLAHTPSQLEVNRCKDNKDTPIVDKDEQKKIIDREFIPLELRSYSLLQGESMDSLVDLSSKHALSRTIDTLAGISTLKGICEISHNMAKKADTLFKQVDAKNSANNQAKIADTKRKEQRTQQKEQLLLDLDAAESEKAAAEAKKEQLDAYISNSTRRNEIRQRLDKVLSKIKDRERQIEQIEMSITKLLFDEDCPWLLIGLEDELDTFSSKRTQYVKDLAIQSNDNTLVIMLPEGSPDTSSLERMLKNEVCEVCGQPAHKGSDAWNHIKLILDRPEKESTTRNDFGQFYGLLERTASSYSRTIPRILSKIDEKKDKLDELRDELNKLEEDREEIFTELNNAGGNASNSQFNDEALLRDYNLAITTISKKEKEIETIQKSIATIDSAIEGLNLQLSRYSKDVESEKFEAFASLLKEIEEIIVETKEAIFDRTIRVLEEEANKKYIQLTEGNQSSGGKLVFKKEHEVVNVSIRDINNGLITGLGTGFQRMKQLAIVMAIISAKIGDEKKFDYPFISDAPFSEFGENFINNFFKVAPGVFTQSIILIKELYDPRAKDFITPFGRKVLENMKAGKLPGTFYVNVIEEKADTTGLVTSHKRYMI